MHILIFHKCFIVKDLFLVYCRITLEASITDVKCHATLDHLTIKIILISNRQYGMVIVYLT